MAESMLTGGSTACRFDMDLTGAHARLTCDAPLGKAPGHHARVEVID
jgi:hypothetical protein